MLKYDNSIVFHPLTDSELLYPQYDAFPLKEKEFEAYFVIHPIPKRSIYKNSITIGCHLSSTKTMKELKAGKTDDVTFLEWLKINLYFWMPIPLAARPFAHSATCSLFIHR